MKIELNEHELRMIVIALNTAKADLWDTIDAPENRRVAKREEILTAITEIVTLINKIEQGGKQNGKNQIRSQEPMGGQAL